MNKIFWAYTCMVGIIGWRLSFTPPPLPAPEVAATAQVRFEQVKDGPDPNEVFRLVNEVRNQSGIAPLVADERLTSIAQARANDMAAKGYYAHVSPAGSQFGDYWSAELVPRYACENLDLHFSHDASLYLHDWLHSPTHSRCLLHTQTTLAGYAVTPFITADYQGKPSTAFILVAIHSTP